MDANWDLISKLVFPIVTAVIIATIAKRREDRPKLVSYLAHAAGFTVEMSATQTFAAAADPVDEEFAPASPSQSGGPVHVHGIVVRNAGKKSAFNVRIGHSIKVHQYVIDPRVPHEMRQSPEGGWEILIPALVPNEQVRVSYLYFAPVIWQQINAYVKSDEGFAQISNVLPTAQPRRWLIILCTVFFYIGVAASVYACIAAAQWCFAVSHLLSRGVSP